MNISLALECIDVYQSGICLSSSSVTVILVIVVVVVVVVIIVAKVAAGNL